MPEFDRVYIQAQAQPRAAAGHYAQAVAQVAQMKTVGLDHCDDPVWPEDERLDPDGGEPGLDRAQSERVLAQVDLRLPDLLLPVAPGRGEPAIATVEVSGFNSGLVPHLIHIPTTFDAPDEISLRRLRLTLHLHSRGQGAAVALLLEPATSVETVTHDIGEVSLDLAAALGIAFPAIPPVFTLKAGTVASVKTVHPRVLSSGLLTADCGWRISDSAIAYGFCPSVVVGTIANEGLAIEARLHIEIRKRVLGIFHRTYFKSALPRLYRLTARGDRLIGEHREWEKLDTEYDPGWDAMVSEAAAAYRRRWQSPGVDTSPAG